MAMHYVKVDITTPIGAPQILYPDGWDPHKIIVEAYDDIDHSCFANLKDEILFSKLMTSGKVIELIKTGYDNEVKRLRPLPPEVQIILRDKGKDQKTDIETFLNSKNLTYEIKEA